VVESLTESVLASLADIPGAAVDTLLYTSPIGCGAFADGTTLIPCDSTATYVDVSFLLDSSRSGPFL